MTSATPLFERLELIDDPQEHDGALNMATDEALLEHLEVAPVLRIYRWARPTVSFGYFDEFEPVRAAFPQCALVRRWTGGGIVEHGRDLTYSLVVPRSHRLTALRAEESYRLLHGVLATAIAAASPEPLKLAEQTDAETPQSSRACFVNPVRHDLLLDGHKIAGAAQRRTRRGWLHQGSVQFPNFTPPFFERLHQTLPTRLAETVLRRVIRPEEAETANRLTETKYGTEAWLQRR